MGNGKNFKFNRSGLYEGLKFKSDKLKIKVKYCQSSISKMNFVIKSKSNLLLKKKYHFITNNKKEIKKISSKKFLIFI